jgi:hypothetical protein
MSNRGKGSNNNGGGRFSKQPQHDGRRCFYCQKPGHFSRNCKQRKRDEASSGQSSQFQQHQQHSAVALSAHAVAATADAQHMRWVLDTSASRHITSDTSVLRNPRPVPGDVTITFGNGGTDKPTAVGEVLLCTTDNTFYLNDVLCIPEATENLISVRQATNRGLDFKFSAGKCLISRDRQPVATAPSVGDSIYYLSAPSQANPTSGS